jgi:hypothetical protein
MAIRLLHACDRLFTAHLKLFMALFLKRASLASVAAGFLILLYSAAGSGAAAQDKALSSVQLQPSLSVFDEDATSNALIPPSRAPLRSPTLSPQSRKPRPKTRLKKSTVWLAPSISKPVMNRLLVSWPLAA